MRHQQFTFGIGYRHLPILWDHAQQGQASHIHGIVHIHLDLAHHPSGNSVDHQLGGNPVGTQLKHHLLRISEGGAVIGDGEDRTVSTAGCQMKPLSDAGRAVNETEVVLRQDLFHQCLHGASRDSASSVKVYRCGKQE